MAEKKTGIETLEDYCSIETLDREDKEKFDEIFEGLLSLQTGENKEDEKEQPTLLQKSFKDLYIFKYFSNYLFNEPNGVKITTIVTEKKYFCLNFLEDYVNYYARCYTHYNKECKRLHFFKEITIDIKEFGEMIMDHDHPNWAYYQGCIVVKPIPKGVFGVTYLNHYDAINSKDPKKPRYYKCLTNQTINLFGKKLIVRTMPFKEQDGIVASCATTAMWMAFHKTSELFYTKAPSLSEITLLAGANENNPGKIFPSHGLRVSQLCKAINNLGMMAEIKTEFESLSYFKSFVHAYLQGDIPVLFGFNFKGDKNKNSNHLVTLNGFRYKMDEYQEKSNWFTSDIIEKFYAHDDQIGPFVRIEIDEVSVEKLNLNNDSSIDCEGTRNTNDHLDITTAWWRDIETANESMKGDNSFKKNKDNYKHARPDYLIVPLSSAIKVSFDDIYGKFLFIHFLTTFYIEQYSVEKQTDGSNFSWNIFIMKNNDYKKNLYDHFSKNKKGNNPLQNVDVMMLSLPKYVWVVRAFIENKFLFDFIFDTVEDNIYGLPICVNIYDEALKKVLEDWGDEVVQSFSSKSKEYSNSLLKKLNQEIKITQQIKNDWAEIIDEVNREIIENDIEKGQTNEKISYENILFGVIKKSENKTPSYKIAEQYATVSPRKAIKEKITFNYKQ